MKGTGEGRSISSRLRHRQPIGCTEIDDRQGVASRDPQLASGTEGRVERHVAGRVTIRRGLEPRSEAIVQVAHQSDPNRPTVAAIAAMRRAMGPVAAAGPSNAAT